MKVKLKRDWLLEQGNDPKQTSKSTMNSKLKLLEMFSQFPYLNIIENLQEDFKHAVHAAQKSTKCIIWKRNAQTFAYNFYKF